MDIFLSVWKTLQRSYEYLQNILGIFLLMEWGNSVGALSIGQTT